MNYKFLFVCALLLNSNSRGVVVGSNTTPSRQALITFPVLENNNEMRGFAAFNAGFKLQNSATSCLFNSLFPVSGTVTFNEGTLTLQKKLILGDGVTLADTGTITGGGYEIHFPKVSTFSMPVIQSSGDLCNLLDSYDLGYKVNSVDWSYDDAYVAVAVDTGGTNELSIFSFDGLHLTLEDTYNLSTDADSVRWHPSSYNLAVAIAAIDGDDVLIFNFNTDTRTIILTGGEFLGGSGNAVAWHPSGNWLVSSSSSIWKEIILFSFAAGDVTEQQLYNLWPSRVVQHDTLSWNASGDYLAVGVSSYTGEDELLLFSFDESTLTLVGGVDTGATVQSLDWSPVDNYIAVGLAGGTETLRVYEHNVENGTLTEKTAARVGETKDILALHWRHDGTKLAMGRRADASGTELRTYGFDSIAKTLTLLDEVDSFDDINSVRWSHNDIYLARGDSLHNLTVYDFISNAHMHIQDSTLVFNSDIILNQPLYLQGNCLVKGNNYNIFFGDMGSLIVDNNATVTLQNITVSGVTNSTLSCYEGSSFTLNDVVWLQDDVYTFTVASLFINNKVVMNGAQSFVYQSDQPCTIASKSTWYFNHGSTYKYAPAGGSDSLFVMMDNTSKLHLNKATLHAAAAGLQLTKGTLVVEGACPVMSDAGAQVDGIILGDGVGASNDIAMEYYAESGLDVQSGFVVYKNVG